MSKSVVARALARVFLGGDQALDRLSARGSQLLGRPWEWLPAVAAHFLRATVGRIRPRLREAVELIEQDPSFDRALRRHGHEMFVAQWLAPGQRMSPVAAAATWDLPVIESAGELADWCWLELGQLDWLADLKRLGYKGGEPRFGHYHYRILPKRIGGVRVIEAPKQRLKRLQREILAEIVEKIPSHPAAHGFVKGRSIRTFVGPHVGQTVVLRMDLQDFFASVGASRIQTIFRMLGYPETVADLLGGICTNAVPRDPRMDYEAQTLYARRHLPQGAPTSPALANVCAYRADCRLSGLARSAGAEYTRYADDLAFSGGPQFERVVKRFATSAAAILTEEGFRVNHRKTRVMRGGVRQHLAGLVANEKLNVRRVDFDRLKATLTNCVRLGPETQNREGHADFRSHLAGRIAFIEWVNPAKGARLRVLFERIQW